MGRDKALLRVGGQPLIVIALEKLRVFCAAVSIAGSREDLRTFAPVVRDSYLDTGPAAGIEAALAGSVERWILVVPVDVPLVPPALLKTWATRVLEDEREGVRLSFLRAGGVRQPACCMLHTLCARQFSELVAQGERKLGVIFEALASSLGPGALKVIDAESLAFDPRVDAGAVPGLFANVNTPEDLASLEGLGSSEERPERAE